MSRDPRPESTRAPNGALARMLIFMTVICLSIVAWYRPAWSFVPGRSSLHGSMVAPGLPAGNFVAPSISISRQGRRLPPAHRKSRLTVRNDDHVALVSWPRSPDRATTGYKVTWGPAGHFAYSFFTPYTDANIQPLVNKRVYQVKVQAVDGYGHLSRPIGTAKAHTDPTYVNSLRRRMTGLFEDFNNGRIDPTLWYTGFDNCSPMCGAFINGNQQHLHLFTQNYGNDRGSLSMRALRPFDFTGRTGTIVWDFDWGRLPLSINGQTTGRYQWYLVLSPQEVDDINFDAVWNNQHGTYPLDGLFVKMDRDIVSIDVQKNGQSVHEWDVNLPLPLRHINVRKHNMLRVSQDSAVLTIAGHTIVSIPHGLGLNFSTAWVYNQQFIYNLPKDYVPFAVSHWDNIGFDAPPGYAPDVLHEYTDGNMVESDQRNIPATWMVSIPDSLRRAVAERLLVDVNDSTGNQALQVRVNNGPPLSYTPINLDDNVAFDARVFTLPPGTLHRGRNKVAITNCQGCMARDVHVEVAFPHGSRARYTPPRLSMMTDTMMPTVGPMPDFGATSPISGTTVSGTIPVETIADGSYALLPTGHVDPVTKIGVLVDGRLAVAGHLRGPTVRTDQILRLDTRKLSNGPHVITLQAWGQDTDTHGARATLKTNSDILFDEDDQTYNERVIVVNNRPGGTSAPRPITATPVPSSEATPLPLDHTPCTVFLAQGSQSGTCSGTFVPH